MPSVDFGEWLPDQADIGPPHLVDAAGCLPAVDHYRPLPGLTETSGAMTARCRGVFSARDQDNAAHMYAADATKIYELEGTTWTDRSKTGGYTTATSNTRYRFATFGDRCIAVNGLDAPQYIDMSTAATQFDDLAGTPGIARFVASYNEFVFLGAISSSYMAIKWSAIGDSESWTPGTNQSDEQEFADGGAVTGLVATKSALYVFQEKTVRRVIYVGGDVIMQIDKLFDSLGCIEPNSLVSLGQRCFFLSEEGWYMWDFESQPVAIGYEKFDRWFFDDSERTYWYASSAVIDPKNHVFACGYVSTASGSDTPDSVLFYNYGVGRATYARLSHEMLASAVSPFTSIDDLSGDVDVDYSISFDDPFWAGGAYYFGAFSTAHKLASFTGDNVAATFETSQTPLFDGQRASLKWIKPVVDNANAQASGGSAVRAGDAITYQTAASQQTSGRCPMRDVNGFYMSAKITIAAAESWTYARGIEFDARPAGLR